MVDVNNNLYLQKELFFQKFYLNVSHKMDHSKMDYKPIVSNPCTDNLSDID